MRFKEFSKYFGGSYMPYWYGAFVLVVGWFVINLFNNASVSRYELTAYDNAGNALGSKIVDARTMTPPEKLPVTKSYKPVKPVKFLD